MKLKDYQVFGEKQCQGGISYTGFAKHMSAVNIDYVLADKEFVGNVFMRRSAKKCLKMAI